MTTAEFVAWTWQMVNGNHDEIGWSDDGTCIVVSNPERLAQAVLPIYFRHQQYASWVRALNAYDFKKAGPNRWSHPSFVRDQEELLKHIRRKPPPSRRAGGDGGGSCGSRNNGGSAAADPHSLVPHFSATPSHAGVAIEPAAAALHLVMQEARQQLWWLQHREAALTAELTEMQEEEFRQRFDAVRIMQAFLSKMVPSIKSTNGTAASSAEPPAPHIIFNPAVIPPEDIPPDASKAPTGGPVAKGAPTQLQLEVTPAAFADATGVVTADKGGGDTRKRRLEEEENATDENGNADPLSPSRPDVAARSPSFADSDAPLFDISELELFASASPLGSRIGSRSASPTATPTGLIARSPNAANMPPDLRLPAPSSEDFMQMLAESLDAGGLSGLPPAVTSSIAELAREAAAMGTPIRAVDEAGKSTTQGPLQPAAANAVEMTTPMAASLLHFASVLSRMPPLPESTSALPARGTLQRDHLEQAINWCFMQIKLL